MQHLTAAGMPYEKRVIYNPGPDGVQNKTYRYEIAEGAFVELKANHQVASLQAPL